MTPRILLRTASIAEAVSWTLLLTGMALKAAGVTDLGVAIAGSLHGAVFIAYLFVGMLVGVNQRWPWSAFILGFLSSIPPFATLLFDWWVERRGMLEGEWRRAAAPSEAPAAPLDGTVEADAVSSGAPAAATATTTATATATTATATAVHVDASPTAAPRSRPAPLGWLDPVVRWSVRSPITLSCAFVALAALILSNALAH